MPRNKEYQFISTDTNEIVSQLISAYEKIAGVTVHPASPERLMIQWVANAIIQQRVLINYTGNQNIPSRAESSDIDALGELFYDKTRPEAQAAICTVRFHISEAQTSAILVPKGTRVTDKNNTLVWETTADAYVPIGDTYVDVMVQCQTVGTIGNGYAPGQINTIVDVFNYYDHCENITESDDGANTATDDEYYELMRASQDAYSTAGAKGGYIYYAKQVSTEIADVVVNSPEPGQVNLYVLMSNGAIAGEEIKNAVLAACNDKYVRPMTDLVVVEDPETVSYDITFTYYIPRNTSLSASEIEAGVNETVAEYISWQSARLGRDINPSYLGSQLMKTGIKRIEMTDPVYTSLRDGSDNTVPQVAQVGTVTITNGGYEDD
mgnify:CR=1 FL=1